MEGHTFGAASFNHSLAWSSQSILHAVAKSLLAFSHSPNNLTITNQDTAVISNIQYQNEEITNCYLFTVLHIIQDDFTSKFNNTTQRIYNDMCI